MTMDPLMLFWVLLIGVIIGLIFGIILVYRGVVVRLRNKIDEITSKKQSLSTTYGMITEQFAPFMKDYPFSPERFRFIGNPIDGIQFENDRIVFVEFKTHESRLSPVQNRIKKLIKNGSVDWFEFRMKQ